MKEPRARLIYPASVTASEVAAALRGMGRFRSYGVLHDSAELGKNDRAGLKGVRNGKSVSRIVTRGATVDMFDLGLDLGAIFFRKDIMPVGLTPHELVVSRTDEYSSSFKYKIGIARLGEGAIVSLAQIRTIASADERMIAVEKAVAHELGHVFGHEGHCGNKGCIMQANTTLAGFVETFVRSSVDFCRECSSTINIGISKLIFQNL